MARIDTHAHLIPPNYRAALHKAGLLSSSAAALPTLLAFAKPGHITFGSDFPFAPVTVGKLFAAGLENYRLEAAEREAIERSNALRLFPRLGNTAPPASPSLPQRARHEVSRQVMRGVARLINTS